MRKVRKRLKPARGSSDLPLRGEYWLIENEQGEDRPVLVWP